MIRRILFWSVAFFFALTTSAKETTDSAYLALYHHYYQLFNTDLSEEFYAASNQMQQNFLEKGQILSYYKIRQNEIFYDAEHGNSYLAIKKANDMIEEMKNSDTKHYDLVYMSLGNIFELRGCYRIALHYYQEALKNIAPNDSMGLAHVYSQLASVNVTRNTEQALQWIERMGNVISSDSLYYKSYLALRGCIYFYEGQRDFFLKIKHEYDRFVNATPSLDNNGEHVLRIMEDAFYGKYDEALWLLNHESQDYNDITSCDIRMQIYKMMGNTSLALKEADKRREIRDSLNNDLIFSNINEINASINISKLNEKTAQDRELLMTDVILLLFMGVGLFISRYITHRRYHREIEEHNKQLAIALDEAKEADRMKNIFIKNIGSQIRTPLNVITSYAQVITNPELELGEKECDKIVQAIEKNTTTITNAVNDLLEYSLEESKGIHKEEQDS